MFESILADLRFAWRMLRKTPGFALVIVLTLGLGIGSNVAIFSVVNAAFLRPLPYKNSDRIVWATEFIPKFHNSIVLAPEYAAWSQQNTSFEQLEAFGITDGVNLSSPNQAAERVDAGHVTPGFFKMLGVQPSLGRTFLNSESKPGHDRVALIGEHLWRNRFHSDPQIIGSAITLGGNSYTVVGVLPANFLYPGGINAGVWIPDAVSPAASVPSRGMSLVSVIGRLKPGVTFKQAQADLNLIARRMDNQYPTPWSGYHAAARVGVISLQQQLASGSRIALEVLMGAVGFILLIVCANVANLFLVRAVTREREIAVRVAIGGSGWRIARLILSESVLCGLAGGALGAVIAFWGVHALAFLMPETLPARIPLDWRVLSFTLGCSIITGVLFGLAPALTSLRIDLHSALKAGAQFQMRRYRLSIRGMLTVTQLALSLILLVGAGLLIRSFVAVLSVKAGFDSHNVLLADVSLAPVETYTPPRQVEFYDRLLASVRALPGVQYAGLASGTPLVPFNEIGSGFRAEGEPESDATVVITSANGDYFRALGIPVLKGRVFDNRDREGAPRVAIVNQALARILFRDRDPLGRRVDSGDGWVTVIGVVADIRHRALDDKIWPEIFQPYQQAPSHWMSLVVRTTTDPSALIPALQKATLAIDRSQPLFQVESLEERVSESVAQRRHRAVLLGAFATLALIIAVVGAYSVMTYSVARRTHEIGVRLALGAERQRILKMVVAEGARLAIAGVVLGLIGAAALTRVLARFLFGVTASDRATFACVCMLLVTAVFFASYLPARRATKIDPMEALRQE